MNKPVLQDAADKINDNNLKDNDNISNIKEVVVLYNSAVRALLQHREDKEKISSKQIETTPIVTADDVREDIYR